MFDSKKKDEELRQHPAYLGLADLGYTVSTLHQEEFGLTFEMMIDGYPFLIYLVDQRIVCTGFFELDDERFKRKSMVIGLLINKKGLLVGRNFIESKTPFEGLSPRDTEKPVYTLLSILSHEDFPRVARDKVFRKIYV